jgi:hypothetical protein
MKALAVIILVLIAGNLGAQSSLTITSEVGEIIAIDSSDWNYPNCTPYAVGDTVTSVMQSGLPQCVQILPPFPNPATDSVTFYFQLPMTASVSLTIHTSEQDSIFLINSQMMQAGFYRLVWDDMAGVADQIVECKFRADQFSTAGDIQVGEVVSIRNGHTGMRSFNLLQNYPNPFNPVSTISFNIPMDTDVSMII